MPSPTSTNLQTIGISKFPQAKISQNNFYFRGPHFSMNYACVDTNSLILTFSLKSNRYNQNFNP